MEFVGGHVTLNLILKLSVQVLDDMYYLLSSCEHIFPSATFTCWCGSASYHFLYHLIYGPYYEAGSTFPR